MATTVEDHRADENFAIRLRARRRKYGYTQTELADLAGVTRETISNWERGTFRPQGGINVRSVCSILRCHPDWLMWGVKEED
ncbi:MAG TPA: helix-turn-helix domain-containing protein [Candidatus Binatus sp.]|nr:helix-turn-helix domain-containing protein [Candidatus Binatus sp.]